MAVFPTTLPKPAISSLRETPPDNFIRSQMDKGPAKVRKRTSANTRNLSFTLKILPPLVETLDTFYETYGADEFDYTHPRTGAAVKARFKEPPNYSEQGGVLYNCEISLEIMP